MPPKKPVPCTAAGLAELLDAIEPGYDHEIPDNGKPTPDEVSDELEEGVPNTWGGVLGVLSHSWFEEMNADTLDADELEVMRMLARHTRSSGLRIQLSTSDDDDGMVTVYCNDQRAAKDDQSIAGSCWESPGDMDVAYAVIMDHPGLLDELKADGYEVDDGEYSPPDEEDCKRWAAKLEAENQG